MKESAHLRAGTRVRPCGDELCDAGGIPGLARGVKRREARQWLSVLKTRCAGGSLQEVTHPGEAAVARGLEQRSRRRRRGLPQICERVNARSGEEEAAGRDGKLMIKHLRTLRRVRRLRRTLLGRPCAGRARSLWRLRDLISGCCNRYRRGGADGRQGRGRRSVWSHVKREHGVDRSSRFL